MQRSANLRGSEAARLGAKRKGGFDKASKAAGNKLSSNYLIIKSLLLYCFFYSGLLNYS